MTYAALADLQTRFGADEINQRVSALNEGALDSILADADAEIDGYLGGVYALPLSPVPPRLVQAACVIARYNLLGDAVTEAARSNYEDIVAWLKAVQSGVVTLQTSTAPVPQAEPATVLVVSSGAPVFKHRGPL